MLIDEGKKYLININTNSCEPLKIYFLDIVNMHPKVTCFYLAKNNSIYIKYKNVCHDYFSMRLLMFWMV